LLRVRLAFDVARRSRLITLFEGPTRGKTDRLFLEITNMKKTTPLWLSALLIAPGLLYCGGDTTDSGSGATAATTGAGGSYTGSGGGSTGSGTTDVTTTGTGTGTNTGTGTGSGTGGAGTGTTTTTVGTGGSAGGTTATTTTTTSGAGGGTTTGTGGMGGAGTGGRPTVDAGACPRAQPANGMACTTAGEVCDYTGFSCSCDPMGVNREGGMRDGWNCVRVRPDAGAGTPDASTCPRANPGTGTPCTSVGEVCPYGRQDCTCETNAGRDRWVCAVPRDAAAD
jgi:hypothetical protein